MNKYSDEIFSLILTAIIVIPLFYFLDKKERRLKKMTPEQRKMKEVRKAIWLHGNSFGAVLYKIGWFFLQFCLVANIFIQTSNHRETMERSRTYRGTFAVIDATWKRNNKLILSVYSGRNEIIDLFSDSNHPESLAIEEWVEGEWKTKQTPTPLETPISISHSTVYTFFYYVEPNNVPIRVGVPWQCKETGETGIEWSSQIDPPRRK